MTQASSVRIECRSLARMDPAALQAWRQLHADHQGCGGAFFSPAYAQAAQLALEREVRVVMFWREQSLVAVMPLQRRAGWWGRWGLFEPVGGDMTDYAGLLAIPGFTTDWPAILRASGVPCLYFTHLDESQQAHGLGGDQPRVGLRTAIHPEGGKPHWEHLRTQDKKLVSDTERRERKLGQDHGAPEFQLQSSEPEADLEALVRLKNSQYLRTGKSAGPLLQPGNVRLLQLLMRHRGPDCRALLSTLKVNGQLVAAHLGLVGGATLHYWFPVYDERFAAYSPGRVLLRHVLLASSAQGIEMIDRGEGDTQAKRDFANQSHVYVRGLVAVGAKGAFLSFLVRLSWKWKSTRSLRSLS